MGLYTCEYYCFVFLDIVAHSLLYRDFNPSLGNILFEGTFAQNNLKGNIIDLGHHARKQPYDKAQEKEVRILLCPSLSEA